LDSKFPTVWEKMSEKLGGGYFFDSHWTVLMYKMCDEDTSLLPVTEICLNRVVIDFKDIRFYSL